MGACMYLLRSDIRHTNTPSALRRNGMRIPVWVARQKTAVLKIVVSFRQGAFASVTLSEQPSGKVFYQRL